MKSFLNRILICVIPVVLSVAVVGWATARYLNGLGGFKLGVDLVGGTILIYEIDATKFPDQSIPANTAQQLAEKLKKRLDPADTFGITVRAASNTRVEIVLPTGGKHQVEEEQRVWREVLDAANQEYPVERYTVRFDEFGRNVKLLGQIMAQHPDLKTSKVRDYIDENAPKETNDRTKWDDFLEKVADSKEYGPKKYTASRGNTDELLTQILAQKGAQIEKEEKAYAEDKDNRNDPRKKLVEFIEKRKKSVQQQSLTTEGVMRVKESISHVGSLRFMILANKEKDKDGIDAAQRFIEKAGARSETTHELTNKQLHDDLDTSAINGFPPPPLKREGNKLVWLGESFDSGENYSYSWVEISPSLRAEYGLNDPRFDPQDAASSSEKDLGQLIHITQKNIDDFYNDKRYEWKKDDARLTEIDKLLQGQVVRTKTQLDPRWLSAAEARYRGKLFSPRSTTRGGEFPGICFGREAKSIRATGKDREKEFEYYALMRDAAPQAGEPEVTGEYLNDAVQQGDEVQFGFRSVGADLFYDFTRHNVGQPMAIILDGYLRSFANIKSAISSRGVITFGSGASQTEIQRTVQNLNAGALPASLRPEAVSENTMGPTLGEDTIFWGSVSVVVAFVAVLLFMVVYYRFAGMVACVALFANLALTVAFMVLVKATFTLPGLAGLVLMLGMAVDANVLIYERLREERERGASLALAIRNGYDRAFPTIIDTHLSSIFTAVVLYIVGNDQLKGFGISLTVGLIISLFTSLYMTRLLFDFWLAKGWLHKLSMFRLLSKTNIDFMAIRYYWFTATIILTIVGGAIFVFRLDKGGLNIDFVGGTAYSAELVERVDTAKLRDLFAESRQDRLLKVADVQPVEEKDGKASKFKITYAKDGDLYTENETVFVELSESATKAQLEKRAGRLEDVSIEKIYVTTAEGGSRDYFTLRTAEKSPDLVQVMIDRLMVEKDDKGKRKDLLKKILLSDYQIDANSGKTAVLSFTDPSGAPEFASTAQMTRLLKRQIDSSYIADLKDKRDELDAKKVPAGTLEEQKKKDEIKKLETEINDLELINNQMTLKGIGPDEGGRFQWMELVLTRPLSKDVKDASSKLETVLGEAKKSFEKRRQPERLENFDSQLAQETQNRALIAIVASWAAILLYLWIRFGNWTFGMAAVLCLVHDLFFTLGIIAFCHWLHDIPFFGSVLGLRDFKIDLQTVAALLTLVGYSVSDTIVVFDRIREVRGKNPELTPKMINDSVNQTLSRTLLTATSVWLVVMVLYFLGGEGVHLFAFVMVVGVIVGTYSSIYIASPLLLIFGEGKRPAGARETVPAPTAV